MCVGLSINLENGKLRFSAVCTPGIQSIFPGAAAGALLIAALPAAHCRPHQTPSHLPQHWAPAGAVVATKSRIDTEALANVYGWQSRHALLFEPMQGLSISKDKK